MSWIKSNDIDKDIASFDPDKLYHELLDVGLKWVEANAAYQILLETKKILLASLKSASSAKTEAAKEAEALSNQEYISHIEKLIAAQKEAETARVRYECMKTYIDMLRSKISLRKTEMQIL